MRPVFGLSVWSLCHPPSLPRGPQGLHQPLSGGVLRAPTAPPRCTQPPFYQVTVSPNGTLFPFATSDTSCGFFNCRPPFYLRLTGPRPALLPRGTVPFFTAHEVTQAFDTRSEGRPKSPWPRPTLSFEGGRRARRWVTRGGPRRGARCVLVWTQTRPCGWGMVISGA